MDSPNTYARHLASYITCATTIRARTKDEFGRAPSVQTIQRMQSVHSRPMTKVGEPKDCDAVDWTVPTFVPKIRPGTARQRDYIMAAPQCAAEPCAEPENPFLGLYSVGARVIASVAFDFFLEPHEITGRSRNRFVVDVRATVVAILKRWGRKSYPEIGKIMGGRDHSTIINAVDKFDIYCRRNSMVWPSYQRHVRLIEEAEAAIAEREVAEIYDRLREAGK